MGNSQTQPKEAEAEQEVKFNQYYQNAKSKSQQWRQRYQELMEQNVMADFWSPPEYLEVDGQCRDDFVPLNTGYRLLHGHFVVFPLVKHKATQAVYRLKMYSRKMLKNSKMRKIRQNILTELQVLAIADHPFILKMKGYFTDYWNICIVTDNFQCGDLQSALLRQSPNVPNQMEAKILTEDETRFIAAQIICGLHYLHSVNIMHRDVKTQNVLIRADGYVVLCDFGFAKYMGNEFRTSSVLGTWEFMAPEVLRGKNYSYNADFWGFGCIVHQMLAGCPPYKKQAKGGNNYHFYYRNFLAQFPKGNYRYHLQQQQQQQQQPVECYTWEHFPFGQLRRQWKVSVWLIDFLMHILHREPQHRLGSCCLKDQEPSRSGAGALQIMSHLWFRNVNFDQIVERKISAPWRPKLQDAGEWVESNWESFDIIDHVDPNCLDSKATSPNQQAEVDEFGKFAD